MNLFLQPSPGKPPGDPPGGTPGDPPTKAPVLSKLAITENPIKLGNWWLNTSIDLFLCPWNPVDPLTSARSKTWPAWLVKRFAKLPLPPFGSNCSRLWMVEVLMSPSRFDRNWCKFWSVGVETSAWFWSWLPMDENPFGLEFNLI